MINKKIKSLIASCCTIGLLSMAGCSNNNTDTAAINAAIANANSAATAANAAAFGGTPTAGQGHIVQLAGVVVDGYMKGATAFVDRNNNGKLDVGEPSGLTDVYGAYNIANVKVGDENYPVVVDIPATAMDSDVPGQTVGKHSIMSAPATGTFAQSVVISPMTTMIKTVMESTPGATRFSAADTVKSNLGLSFGNNVDLFSDYVALKNQGANASDYAKVHKLAQVIARTVANQVDTVNTTAIQANPQATLADVVGLITAQVVTQLSSIESVVNNTKNWTPSVADTVAVNNTVPLDTYGQTFITALKDQMALTLAASQTALKAANLATAKANLANANANAANTAALATLKSAQLALAQAQQLQDTYTVNVATGTKNLAVQAAAKVAKDPYATAAQQTTATQSQAIATQNVNTTTAAAATQKQVIATAIVAIQNKPAVALNKVPFTVRANPTNRQNFNNSPNFIAKQGNKPLPPIAGAVIVVDQGGPSNTFTTDAYGQTMIPGMDVGLHNIHIFAKGYTWMSIYQMTADIAGNTATLDPYYPPTTNSLINGNGWSNISFDLTLPPIGTGVVGGNLLLNHTVGVEAIFKDAYGFVQTAYPQFTGNGSVFTFQTQANAGTKVSGTLTVREITCDLYATNCQETNLAAGIPVSTITSNQWGGVFGTNTPVSVTYAATHKVIPYVSANSQVMLDVYASNTLVNMTPGLLLPQGQSQVIPNLSVFLSVTDAYGQVIDYPTSVISSTVYTPAFPAVAAVKDVYGAIITPAVPATPASWKISGPSQATFAFNNIPAGTTVTGTLTAVETSNAAVNGIMPEIDRVNLGTVTWTTTATPFPVYAWGGNGVITPKSNMPPLTIAMNKVKPVAKPVLSVSSLVAPRGLILSDLTMIDGYSWAGGWGLNYSGYYDNVNGWAGVTGSIPNPVSVPYTFTSTRNLATLPLFFSAYASSANNMESWILKLNILAPLGTNVNMASSFTSAPSLQPLLAGNGVNITSALPAKTTGYHLMEFTDGNNVYYSPAWRVVAPLSMNTVNLPVIPQGIGGNMIKGHAYGLNLFEVKMSNQTYQGLIAQRAFGNNGNHNRLPLWQEEEYRIFGIPYQF